MNGEAYFDAGRLEATYALLGALPEILYQATIATPVGSLLGRVNGLLEWRRTLLQGQLPTGETLSWPPQPLQLHFLEALKTLNVARFCKGEETLVDALLLDLLKASSTAENTAAELLEKALAELKEREEAERVKAELDKTKQAKPNKKRREEAKLVAFEQAAMEAEAYINSIWQERVGIWSGVWEVFGELGELCGIGRDLSKGVLRSQGWNEMLRLRKLLEQLPQLQELIRTLGRMQTNTRDDLPPVLEEIFGPVRRVGEEERQTISPLSPTETRGIERSGEIARMLPSEAVLLTHPTLKKLWHARRAERSLITYRVEGVYSERVVSEKEFHGQHKALKPRNERGPILVCLDTSGSMAGAPERISKALVLEAMRVALQEKRACYLYSFSGPNQVEEQELSLSDGSFRGLLTFLLGSFHGGTDVAAPLARAVKKLDESTWERADLLMVSDGEFSVSQDTTLILQQAKEKHLLRTHGVLIGSAQSYAMESICSHLHRFRDWSSLLRLKTTSEDPTRTDFPE